MDFKKFSIVFSGVSAKSGGGGEVMMKQFRYERRLSRDGDDEGAATEEEAPAIAQYDRPRRSARLALTEPQVGFSSWLSLIEAQCVVEGEEHNSR